MNSLSPVVASQSASLTGPELALAYLRNHDDPMRWETPRMFNRCAELRRFERFVHSFEARIGRRLDHEVGSGVEDAAFHGDVFLEGATLRFSNFGRMIAVLDGHGLSLRSRRLIARIADEHGYIVIPDALLSIPYSGVTRLASSRETWGSRFFGARCAI